jgi:hypothetical protein
MPLKLQLSADQVSALTNRIPAQISLGPLSGLHYVGTTLTIPDGELTVAVSAIIANPNWETTPPVERQPQVLDGPLVLSPNVVAHGEAAERLMALGTDAVRAAAAMPTKGSVRH